MSGFLLDTNVLSEFSRKGEPDQAVKGWLASNDPESRYVSVLTLAEIRRGIELLLRASAAINWNGGSKLNYSSRFLQKMFFQ